MPHGCDNGYRHLGCRWQELRARAQEQVRVFQADELHRADAVYAVLVLVSVVLLPFPVPPADCPDRGQQRPQIPQISGTPPGLPRQEHQKDPLAFMRKALP